MQRIAKRKTRDPVVVLKGRHSSWTIRAMSNITRQMAAEASGAEAQADRESRDLLRAWLGSWDDHWSLLSSLLGRVCRRPLIENKASRIPLIIAETKAPLPLIIVGKLYMREHRPHEAEIALWSTGRKRQTSCRENGQNPSSLRLSGKNGSV
ncbi:hypothetical protein J7T55_005711 [Diaporthe amygdali]|uniref:uncharacterized protein n=1 Tax=Phomopsis amygdali TaxID=1214568 RepID=UPI0022FF01C5|nr:uncharacterized protein J7T55_005711 [Diaporthe amygdali]KAJ0124373.1 hypothetical protein J7T55_005711 [Diaporthe amygdali]